ncbi:MAG TPA: SOS response-associated peptidase [Gemmataceae bacterium]|nr:SOS response-associated peptidase [Gemmataceae bacterium]
MCGRFLLTVPATQLSSLFQFMAPADDGGALSPRYNIAPSQSIATVRNEQGDRRELAMVHWGLIPAWAKDRHTGQGLMNACSETAASKPSFRDAFRKRRCLVLADGFYEWKRGSGKKKQPFAIRLWDGSPFGFAGLWERWQGADGRPVESCAILTTEANELVKPIHDRMPVILRPEHYGPWLDPSLHQVDVLQPMLVPFDATALTLFPVNPWVNDAQHEGPRCLERIDPEPSLF